MKNLAWVIMAMVSILGLSALMAQPNPPKIIAEFPGASLKWVHAAQPEFDRKKLDLGKYTITIVEQNDSVTVILKSTDAAEGTRGSAGSYPGFEVEITKKDLRIARSNYVR